MAPPKAPVYVDTDDALSRLCEQLQRQTAVAVDTESNPLFAYRERLCLVQISTERRDYLIDPLAGVDLALLSPVFADPGVVKVLHDAEFDVLMLRRVHPFEFSSIFDTKVAATALGIARVGLAPMLQEFFGVTADKKYQRSDWGRRPLSDEQIEYAALDTRHLIAMATELRVRLHEVGEPAVLEVAAECRRLCGLSPEPRKFDPDEFVRIKGVESLGDRSQQALRELYRMRHHIADRRDVPAFKILSNDMLFAVARARPKDQAALQKVRPISPKLARRYGESILEAVARADKLGGLKRLPRKKTELSGLSDAERDLYEDLRAWRKRKARARPTDSSLVLSRGRLAELARLKRKPKTVEQLAETGLLEPWRVALYGEELVAVLNK